MVRLPGFESMLTDILSGWFPFMVYSAEWVGETYLRYGAPAHRSTDRLGEVGKIGSTAMIVFSVVTSIASVVLPWIIQVPEEEVPTFTARPPAGIAPVLRELDKRKPMLVNAWFASHFIFAAAMFLTPMAKSLQFATILVAMCGL